MNEKKAGVAISISDETDFRVRKTVIIPDKKGHYILIKGSILQEDVTILTCMCLTTQHQNM